MRAVPAVDSTAMNSMVALYERCQKNGVTLILSHVNEQPMHVMEKAGFVDMIGRDHFCPNIEAALDLSLIHIFPWQAAPVQKMRLRARRQRQKPAQRRRQPRRRQRKNLIWIS